MDNHDFERTSERENQLLENNRNLEAQKAFHVSNIEEAQKQLSEILHKVIYPDVTVMDQLKALRIKNEAEAVDYEFKITGLNQQPRDYLARSEMFITPRGERSNRRFS